MSAARRPNILIFHCHDLGQHLRCYGVPTVRTPNLDAFAASGVRFARSFCTSPSCSPSRAALFTGRYPHNTGVLGLTHCSFAWDLNRDQRHLAQILRDAGYTTSAIGQLHETHRPARELGYEQHDSERMVQQAVDKAIGQLPQLSGGNKPFYLYLGVFEPHRMGEAPEKGGLPGEYDFLGKHLQPDDADGVYVPPYLRDTPGTRRELAELQGAIRHVDTQFGRLIAALREHGLEGDTLVLFTTDHGIAMPRAKCSLYEPGLEVALLLRLPGRAGWEGGIVRDELVSNIDVLPTLLEALGLEIPSAVQGCSFAPLLDGRGDAPRSEVFAEMTYHDYYDPRRSIRTATDKLIVNFTNCQEFMDPSQRWRRRADTATPPGRHPPVELYDLASDPWEQRNLADDPAHVVVRDQLTRRLLNHLERTEDPILRGAVASPSHGMALAALRQSRSVAASIRAGVRP